LSAPIIPGLVYSGSIPSEPPIVVVSSREKAGKSTLAATLFDWPKKGDRPLVIAWDPTGPDAAKRIGVSLPVLKVRDEMGSTYREKTRSLITKLELAFANGQRPFTSLVIDCASTMTDRIFDETQRTSTNSDPRSHYGEVLGVSKSFFYRLMDLGVPTIWLSWLREPETVTDKGIKRFIQGGPQVLGKFRETLSGKAHVLALLEKTQPFPGENLPVSSDGFVRKLHVAPYGGVNCETRYALPNPCPANLGWILHWVMNGYNPQQQQAGQ
jgi:hypothetical protein